MCLMEKQFIIYLHALYISQKLFHLIYHNSIYIFCLCIYIKKINIKKQLTRYIYAEFSTFFLVNNFCRKLFVQRDE